MASPAYEPNSGFQSGYGHLALISNSPAELWCPLQLVGKTTAHSPGLPKGFLSRHLNGGMGKSPRGTALSTSP